MMKICNTSIVNLHEKCLTRKFHLGIVKKMWYNKIKYIYSIYFQKSII